MMHPVAYLPVSRFVAGICILAHAASCSSARDGERYTLYRNSATDETMRIHWASFDAAESGSYNRENCAMAADLLNANLRRLNPQGTTVRFWCEAGEPRDLGPAS